MCFMIWRNAEMLDLNGNIWKMYLYNSTMTELKNSKKGDNMVSDMWEKHQIAIL